MFKQMQYATMNYLGFIGYQLSEQDFWDLGYYTHYDENHLPKYYSDVPVSNWANGVRDKIMNLPGKGEVHVTDVNTGKGPLPANTALIVLTMFSIPINRTMSLKIILSISTRAWCVCWRREAKP